MLIRTKLVLALVPIALMSMMVTGWYFKEAARQSIEISVEDQLNAVATIHKNKLLQVTDLEEQLVSSLTSRWALRKALERYNSGITSTRESMERILAAAVQTNDNFWSLSIIDLNGLIIVSTSPEQLGLQRGAEAGFPSNIESFVVGDFFLVDSQEPVQKQGVYLSGPLVVNGEALGALIVQMDATAFIGSATDRTGLGDTGEVLLAKRQSNGSVLFVSPLRFDSDAAMSRIVDDNDGIPINSALAGQESFFTGLNDYRSHSVFAVSRYLPSLDLGLVVKIDVAEAMSQLDALNQLLLQIILVVMLSLVAFMILISNSITKPLLRLTQAVQSLRNGRGSLPEFGSKGEVGILASTLNNALIQVEQGLKLEAEKNAAEEAVAAQASFFSKVNHELRTPLTSIIGFLCLTLKLEELSPKVRRQLDIAYNASHSLMVILNNVLDYAKLDFGAVELERLHFDVQATAQNVLHTLEVQAEEKSIELLLECTFNEGHFMYGDPTRLNQILMNLVGNAIKFTDAGSVKIHIQQEGEEVHFCIKDTGIGIDKEVVDTIFQPFLQADNTITRRFGGTGLGTAIALQLVEKMNGRIWIKSELGIGSEFHFVIPFNRGHMTQAIDMSELEGAHTQSVESVKPQSDISLKPLSRHDLEHILERLGTLYHVLNTPTPDPASSLLDEITTLIDASQLESISKSIQNYDFSKAQKEVQVLWEIYQNKAA